MKFLNRLAVALALLVSGSAFATDIKIVVSYTANAAATAGGYAALNDHVQQIINDTNAAYTASGININLIAYVLPTPTNTAKPDTAPLADQYRWVYGSVEALQAKTQLDASIAIHLSDPGAGLPNAALSPWVGTTQTASMVLPVRYLDSQMELEISLYNGAGIGYSQRKRSYQSDPAHSGFPYCFHTREAAPSSPSQQVPMLSYWSVYGVSDTQAGSPQDSCSAYLTWWNNQYHDNKTTSSVSVVNGQQTCTLSGGTNGSTGGIGVNFTALTGSSTVNCNSGDTRESRYSSPGLHRTDYPYDALGTTNPADGANSVAKMNAQIATTLSYKNQNAGVLARVKTTIWDTIKFCANYPISCL